MIFLSIATKLNYLNETKESIKNAIIEKGVEVSDSDTFRDYATKIADISSGGGAKSEIRHFFDGTNTLYNIQVLTGIITEEE